MDIPGAHDGKCKWCGEPVPPGKHKGRPRLFCVPAHRAAFRNARQQQALEDAIGALDASQAVLDEAQAGIEQARALVSAQRTMLISLRQTPRKPRPDVVVLADTITVDSQFELVHSNNIAGDGTPASAPAATAAHERAHDDSQPRNADQGPGGRADLPD